MSRVERVVETVVKYWSGFLKDTSTSKFDNGDDSSNGMMTTMLAMMSKPSSHPESEVEAFEKMLFDAIMQKQPRHIGVDYHPDLILGDVAEQCLTNYNSMTVFPCKTTMWINYEEGIVKVSEGYGADVVVLELVEQAS